MATDTVTVPLPRETYQKLKRAAEQSGVEPGELLRRLIDEAGGVARESAHDRGRRFFGAVDGLPEDLSSNPAHLGGYGA